MNPKTPSEAIENAAQAYAYEVDGCHSEPFIDFKAGWKMALEKDPRVIALAESCETGAFHHTICPWWIGKSCLCAKQKIDEALAQLKGGGE